MPRAGSQNKTSLLLLASRARQHIRFPHNLSLLPSPNLYPDTPFLKNNSLFSFAIKCFLFCGLKKYIFFGCNWSELQHAGSPLVVVGRLPSSMWDLSSLTRDGTCILYIGRQILNHWTIREDP